MTNISSISIAFSSLLESYNEKDKVKLSKSFLRYTEILLKINDASVDSVIKSTMDSFISRKGLGYTRSLLRTYINIGLKESKGYITEDFDRLHNYYLKILN